MSLLATSVFDTARGGSVYELREHNLSLVLRFLRDNGPSSRARIAEGCGLALSSLTEIIAELHTLGFVEESTPASASVGRPKRLVGLSGRKHVVMAIQVDVDGLHVELGGIDGSHHDAFWLQQDLRDQSFDSAHALFKTSLMRGVQSLRASQRLATVEISVPGSVARDAGVVGLSTWFGWKGLPLRNIVIDDLRDLEVDGVFVGVDNDKNFGALFAAREGLPGGEHSSAIYIHGERGVGGGIIVGRDVYRGSHGGAGEFGHLAVDHGGRLCKCGRVGCLETRIGIIPLLVDAGLKSQEDAEQAVFDDPAGAAEELYRAARAGDPVVLTTLKEAGEYLGLAVDSALILLNPDSVILDGYLTTLREFLVPQVQQRIAPTIRHLSRSTALETRTHGTSVALAGALVSAVDQCLLRPTSAA